MVMISRPALLYQSIRLTRTFILLISSGVFILLIIRETLGLKFLFR
jgi:hypothetical protein